MGAIRAAMTSPKKRLCGAEAFYRFASRWCDQFKPSGEFFLSQPSVRVCFVKREWCMSLCAAELSERRLPVLADVHEIPPDVASHFVGHCHDRFVLAHSSAQLHDPTTEGIFFGRSGAHHRPGTMDQ